MPASPVVLALDAGTTGATALVLDRRGRVRGRGYAELPQHFPRPGWVEHDPHEIWHSVLSATRAALAAARRMAPVLARRLGWDGTREREEIERFESTVRDELLLLDRALAGR